MPTAQEIQDAMLLIQTFEEQSAHSMTEESAFVPAARTIINMMTEMKIMQNAFTPRDQIASDVLARGGSGAEKEIDKYLGKFGLDSSSLPDAGTQVDTKQATAENSAGMADYAAAYFQDCVPCLDRARFLASYSPVLPFDVFNAILDDLESRLKWLFEILRILGNTDVWGDICTLTEFLSFMCIPDLVGMLIFLSSLMSKYNAAALANLNMLPGFWISNMFYIPFLLTVYAVIANYIGMMQGLIKCVTNSIDNQLNKMDLTRLGDDNPLFDPEKQEEYSKWVKNAKNRVRGTGEGLGSALALMRNALKDSLDFVTGEMRDMGDSIKNFFAGGDASNWTLSEFIRTKVILARLIGFVRFFIELATEKARSQWSADIDLRGVHVKCSEPDQAYQNMLDEFASFFDDILSQRVVVERDPDGKIKDISWTPLPDPEAFEESAREYFDHFGEQDKSTEKQSQPLTADPDDNDNIRDKIKELMERKVTISCKNIGALFSGEDSAKLQEWLNDLMEP